MKRMLALVIECENAAFGETQHEQNEELVKVLQEFIIQLERTHSHNPTFTIRDGNGNKVGYALLHHGPHVEVLS